MHQKTTGQVLTRGMLFAILCMIAIPCGDELCAQEIRPKDSTDEIELTLPQAIELALKQNRSLLLSRLVVNDYEHKKEIARASFFPQIKNESSLLHITELAGIDIPAGAFGSPIATGPIPDKSLFIGQGSHTSYTSGTGLTQPVTQLFKIREQNRAAAADVSITSIKVRQTEDEVALKVRQIYFGVLIAQLNEEAAIAQTKASEIKNQESLDAVAQGRTLEIDALESRANLLEAKQAELTGRLQLQDLRLQLSDLLGLPLRSQLELTGQPSSMTLSIPTREDCLRIAQQQNPQIRAAQQAVVKANAGSSAAKDEYIPNLTAMARYSYQSGVPLLVHNFGTFGLNFSYDLFDGGRRRAEVKDARTLLSEAKLNLTRVSDEVSVAVETAYDKVEQMQGLIGVAQGTVEVRTEAARLADRQFEQTAALASTREQAHAKIASAKASLLEATLGLSLAQADLKRTIGQLAQ